MRLGIDLDGVVADFNKGWTSFYNRQFGTDLKVDQVVAWNGMTELTHFADMDDFWEWTSRLDGHSLFWHLEPFPGAVESLRELSHRGHQIVVLTTKPEFAVRDTHEWISLHGIPTSEVHILEEKWRVDCDAYLDDGPEVLLDLIRHRPESVVCRYVRPWNLPVPGAVDVAGWDEFRALIDRLRFEIDDSLGSPHAIRGRRDEGTQSRSQT